MSENTIYKHQDYQVRSNDPYALAKYRVVLRWLPQADHLTVLNAGCGSGEMNALLARNRSWHIDAIDTDPDAVTRSLALKADMNLMNVQISQNSIEDFRPQHLYDLIVCNDVIEHISDDAQALARLTALLRPGGRLYITVPALQWLFGYHDTMLGHFRRYNRRRLTARVTPYARVTRCRYFGFTLIPIAVLYSRWLKRAYPVGKQGKGSLPGAILLFLLRIEEHIALPSGTSLILMAEKPLS